MSYEPQHSSIRNLVLSNKKQTTLGTALIDADMTKRIRFDGGSFAQVPKDWFTDAALAGKSHDWPTSRAEISRGTGFDFAAPAEVDLVGIVLSLLFAQESVAGSNPYTHTFTFNTTSRIAPVTTIYTEDTADIKTKYPDMAVASVVISGGANGPLSVQVSLLGTGKFTDGSVTLPAVPTASYLMGQDTDILIGAQGSAATIKERVRGWEARFSAGIELHRAPGGGVYGTMLKMLKQRSTVSLTVAAKDTDDMRAVFLTDTLRELQINTATSSTCTLNLKWPGLYLTGAPYSVDGSEIMYRLETDEASVIKSGSNALVQAVVINTVAAYLVAG